MKIKQIVDRLKKFDYYSPFEFIGCSDEEISELESLLPANYRLPSAYRQFLKEAGHRAADYRIDENFSYRSIHEAAKTNLIGHWSNKLKDSYDGDLDLSDAFIISYDADSFLVFIKLSEGDDPPVYAYQGDDHACIRGSLPLSEAFTKSIDSHLHFVQTTHNYAPHIFKPIKQFKDSLSKVIQWSIDSVGEKLKNEHLERINKLKRMIVNAYLLDRDRPRGTLKLRGLFIDQEDIQFFKALNPYTSQLVEHHLTNAKQFIDSKIKNQNPTGSTPVYQEEPEILSDIHQTLVNRNLKFEGLSQAEMRKHLSQFGDRNVPAIYREFLELYGKKFGNVTNEHNILHPNNYFLEYEKYLQHCLRERIDEKHIPFSFYAKMIVIGWKGDDMTLFILNDEGDDPPVYRYEYYEDYTEECVQESPHFSTYLMKILTKGMQ